MVNTVILNSLLDNIALAQVSSIVIGRDNIVSKPNRHIDFGAFNSLQLPRTSYSVQLGTGESLPPKHFGCSQRRKGGCAKSGVSGLNAPVEGVDTLVIWDRI